MKQLLTSSLSLALMIALSATVPATVMAWQTQSQEGTQNTTQRVNFECQGTSCNASAENNVSQSFKQSQSQDVGYAAAPVQYRVAGRVAGRTKVARAVNVNYVMVADNTSGSVRLSWPMRGGTCQVRYGEVTRGGYPYATSAGCDDGGVTIGSLVPGRKYRVQVSQDGTYWTRPVVVIAR